MTKTENFGLNKPDATDLYDVEVANENAEIIDEALTKSATHESNKNNPHGVTKEQVGLGNVPNVSTNNQTPTYSDITTLSTLSSGESVSTAFAKIKLAITNLISHHANVSNPHNVTKAQIGLGNVDNTADASKPVSTAQQTAIDNAFYNANLYTDEKVAELINGAPTTLDTLKEIADAMTENESVVEALDEAIGTKANESEFNSHVANTNNPHSVTKAQVGLGNVDNTSDLDKPISNAVQTELTTLNENYATLKENLSNSLGDVKLSVVDGILYATATVDGVERTKKIVTLKGEPIALVPILTSDDGYVIYSAGYDGSKNAYQVFDDNDSSSFILAGTSGYIGYNFNKEYTVSKVVICDYRKRSCKFYVQYYDSFTDTWLNAYEGQMAQTGTRQTFTFDEVTSSQFRVYVSSTYESVVSIDTIQFYGYE